MPRRAALSARRRLYARRLAHLWAAVLARLDILREVAIDPARIAEIYDFDLDLILAAKVRFNRRGRGGDGSGVRRGARCQR